MFQYSLLKKRAGLIIYAGDDDFGALYDMIHELSNRSPIVREPSDTFLGFAYDIRHARMGGRVKVKPPKDEPERGIRDGFKISWPLLVLYERLLRHSLAFVPHNALYQSLAYGLEAVVANAIKQDFKADAQRALDAWRRFVPTHPAYIERVTSRVPAYHRWTSAERGRHFADLLDSFDPMYGMLPERFYAETPHLIRLAELDAWEGAEFPEL